MEAAPTVTRIFAAHEAAQLFKHLDQLECPRPVSIACSKNNLAAGMAFCSMHVGTT